MGLKFWSRLPSREAKMFKRIMLALTFAVVFSTAGIGITNKADAWRSWGWGRSYGSYYYAPREAYYAPRVVAPYRAYYGPRYVRPYYSTYYYGPAYSDYYYP